MIAQVYMNTAETLLALFALFALSGARRWAVLSLVMAANWSKTIFYFSSDLLAAKSIYDFKDPNFWLIVVLPVSFWLWIPLLVIKTSLNAIDSMCATNQKKKQ